MTVEEFKSLGLNLGNAKMLKEEIDALASPAASSSPATASSPAAAAAASSSCLSSPAPALDASVLAPFISRVMDADDEDLDLRSPIEVRAGRRSACNSCERRCRVTDASPIAGAGEAAAGDVC